ncbi:DUF4375 domain-containing protein [uncultured Tateyamaria sp.]|uniref:DMP19 family protein n=1 Tax=uncultured Tateyamaria sp. TaxID=455651 RepID=UPI0026023F18|nr:DUF4375 domain-containing protein [uncultured Tateyamaria sp.]
MNDQKALEKWNGFVARTAEARLSHLNERDRALYLAYWYQSEVNNGGHLQYFLNRSAMDPVQETAAAIRALRVNAMANVFEDAIFLWCGTEGPSIETVEDYIDEALENEFESLDSRFAACEKDLYLAMEAAVVNDLPLPKAE